MSEARTITMVGWGIPLAKQHCETRWQEADRMARLNDGVHYHRYEVECSYFLHIQFTWYEGGLSNYEVCHRDLKGNWWLSKTGKIPATMKAMHKMIREYCGNDVTINEKEA